MSESKLKTFVTEIADSIRYVEETTDKIKPCNFKEKIKSLKVELEQERNVTPNESQQIIEPKTGKKGIKRVVVEPIPNEYVIPEGQLEIIENGIYNVANKQSVKVLVDSGDIDEYDGQYEVTPSTNEEPQVLQTKNKTLLDNIKIKPIPFYQVDNQFEGTTVYIGSEVDE